MPHHRPQHRARHLLLSLLLLVAAVQAAAQAGGQVGVQAGTPGPTRATAPEQDRGPRALDATSLLGTFVARGDVRDGYRPADRQLAEWALAAWQRAADGRLRLAPASETRARVRLYWAGPQGGQYGEMRSLSVDGAVGAAVYIRPDTRSLGPDIDGQATSDPLFRDAVVFLTCVHELGHAFGLEHTDDYRDIMYSFQYGGDIVEYFARFRRRLQTRDDIAHTSGMSDGDVAALRRLYPLP